MKYAKDGYAVDAAVRRGTKLPDWYLDEPQEHGTDAFYFNCFWYLDTVRNFEKGPIPWDKAKEYAEYLGLFPDVVMAFVETMLYLDSEYLNYVAEIKRKESR